MKNILNISVIAALAILPMAANAAVGDVINVNDPVHADLATAAQTEPGYALATEGANDGNLATASYVKGAYNATMKAINKVATMAENATDSENISYDPTDSGLTAENVQDAIDELASEKLDKADADVASDGNYITAGTGVATNLGALDTQVKTNADNITTLNGADTVAGSVANTVKTTAAGATYNATASGLNATTLQGAIDALDTAVDGLTTDYAKKTGVKATITASTVTVPVLATWGSDTATTVDGTITGADYTEPANP